MSKPFNYRTAKTEEDQEDIAAAKLLYGLSVRSDPQAYLLTILYRAGDSALQSL